MGEMVICFGGEWTIKNVIKGNRYLICKINNGKESFNLVNLHAPAVQKHRRGEFFREIMGKLILEKDRTFLIGDFNVVLSDIDRIGIGNPDTRGAKELQEIIEVLDIKDSFRDLYPEKREFTFKMIVNGGHESKSRLDRIYSPTD